MTRAHDDELTPERIREYQVEWLRLKDRVDWLVETSWGSLNEQALQDRSFEIKTVYGAIANLAAIVRYAEEEDGRS